MPAYSFQRQFVPKVESGEKTHTVRGKRKHGPEVGMIASRYYAMRTKQCRFLGASPITKVQDIVFEGRNAVRLFIDENQLAEDERETFAIADGFEGWWAMRLFWADRLSVEPRWNGDVIHWLHPQRTYVPYTTADACWCQPFADVEGCGDWRTHPRCPMHGKKVKRV